MKGYCFWAIVASIAPGIIGLEHTSQNLLNGASQCTRPNVVFILTDDQDTHLNSLEYMPRVRRHLIEQGTHFRKHYCTTAVCCPSRVTLWTGKAAHNTNITDVNPPYGMLRVMRSLRRATKLMSSSQEDIPGSWKKASTITTYQYGYSKRVITLTIPGNCLMFTP